MMKAFLLRLDEETLEISRMLSFKQNKSMNWIMKNCLERHLLEDCLNLEEAKKQLKKQEKTPYLPDFAKRK